MTHLPMTCPKCGGGARVVDTFPTENNEVYRRRRCDDCWNAFYTIEFEVEDTKELEKELRDTPRRARHRKPTIRDLRIQAFNTVCPNCKDCQCDGLDADCKKIKRWIDKQIQKGKNNG